MEFLQLLSHLSLSFTTQSHAIASVCVCVFVCVYVYVYVCYKMCEHDSSVASIRHIS
jgi:hypothetical protein